MGHYLSLPLRAFYDRSLYRWAGGEWTGTGMLYLFLLLAVCWLLLAGRLYFVVAGLENEPEVQGLIDQIPPIEIEGGRVSADVEQPYAIRDRSDPDFVMIIDTTGQVTELDPNLERGLLLTEDRLVIKRNRWETRELDLSQIESFSLDAERVRGWLTPLALGLSLVVAVLMPLVSLAYRAILALILAGFGQAAAPRFNASLDWSGLLRVAAIAMTPAIVIDTLTALFAFGTFSGCAWWFVCGAANLGYMIFGVAANRTASPAPPQSFGEPPAV